MFSGYASPISQPTIVDGYCFWVVFKCKMNLLNLVTFYFIDWTFSIVILMFSFDNSWKLTRQILCSVYEVQALLLATTSSHRHYLICGKQRNSIIAPRWGKNLKKVADIQVNLRWLVLNGISADVMHITAEGNVL